MAHDVAKRDQPQPINIFLESVASSVTSAQGVSDEQRALEDQKDEAILVLLGQLALCYWRPDFTPGQAKQLYSQYLDDLRQFAFKDIAEAIKSYRRDKENKFFPTPGQLRGLLATPYSWDPNPHKHMPEMMHAARMEIASMLSITQQTLKSLAAE